MDVEKLIEAVRLCGSTPKVDQCNRCAYWAAGDMSKCISRMTTDAATALSTLQEENEKLREKIEDARLEGYIKGLGEMSEENERLWAELEQVKRERDSAILVAQCYTEKVDNPCTVCRHRFNEVGAPLKKRCENCGLTGTPECGWEFDFNWDLKED